MKDNKHIVKIRLSQKMTDKHLYGILERCSRENAGKYSKMEEIWVTYSTKTRSLLADKLVDFIFHYKGGILSPDKWGYYEPVRMMVDQNTEDHLRETLSRPTLVFLKKTRSPQVYISITNEEFPEWEPHQDLVSHLSGSEISIFPDSRRKLALEEWCTLLQDLCREMETDYGYIQNMDTNEVLAHVFSIPYLEELHRNEKEILGIRRMLEVVRLFEDSPYPTLGWYSKLFYPFSLDGMCKDFIKLGLYALDLLRDTLSLLDMRDFYYGLRLNMDRTIRDIRRVRWDDPSIYWDSVVFLSRQDLRETFHYPDDSETDKIHPLSKGLSPLFSHFNRVYFKERSNEVLLIP